MKIKSIHIYSHDGRRRDIFFSVDGLNVITGRSSTGKSALSDIIEYCMGRSTFNVPEGVIRDKVSWYSVLYQFPKEQVLVAKPTPSRGGESCSAVVLRRGVELVVPSFEELIINSDDDAVVSLLSRLLGIPENMIDVPLDNTRARYSANVKHTHYYLFQKQGLVANKEQMFYRQNEQFQHQAIKDTLPIVLGVYPNERYSLELKLRAAQRELKLNTKLLDQASDEIDTFQEKAISLISEARAVGVIGEVDQSIEKFGMIEILNNALSWKPSLVPNDDGDRISQLEDDLNQLRKMRREVQSRVNAAQQFSKRARGFASEAAEQIDRLASIRAFPKDPQTGEWQWPFCEPNLALETPIAKILLDELDALAAEMRIVSNERPKLDEYLATEDAKIQEIVELIKKKEVEISAAIAANELIEQMNSRNNAAARIVGRISLFLETVVPSQNTALLETKNKSLKIKVDELERKIGADRSNERLASILNNISSQVSRFIQLFEAEFSALPVRLDINKLTIVFDRLDRSIPMYRTGGGENHLAYHLSTLLGLHLFAAKNNCPIPRFILIDQPTQVYFPSEQIYKQADGSVEKTEADADIVAVRRLFELLLKYTREDVPGFQIIVTEHANLRDQWFQNSLVERPWTKRTPLVPEDWPNGSV